MLIGLCFGVIGSVIYGIAPTGGLFALGILAGAGVGLFNPSLQGLMTRAVEPSAQGQLQGATGSLQGLTGLIGPGLFAFTFASFIGGPGEWQLPGAPFLLSALLILAALVMGWMVTRRGGEEAGGQVGVKPSEYPA
jgi:DHA1 family tetracycline resistance protein-like MFS transporter